LFNDYSPPVIYRQDPSPAVDEAWEKIAKLDYFGVTAEDIHKMGKDAETAVVVPEDWGMGSNLYLVQLDGQHHLHCLNAIRKFAYFDYYLGDKFTNL
jgi:hypothetical protein